MEKRLKLCKLNSLAWLVILILTTITILINLMTIQFEIGSRMDFAYKEKTIQVPKGFFINTNGCRIVEFDPFDPSIEEYINLEKPPVCNDNKPPLFQDNFESIDLIEESLPFYYEKYNWSCCYAPFVREPDKVDSANAVKFGECIDLGTSVKITDEFVKVTCIDPSNSSAVVYEDYFSFVPSPPASKQYSRREKQKDKFNVLVIGLDAVSHMNLYRQMPKTVEVLKNLSAIEFFGYNKVGDNTYPNLVPVFSGLSETEFEPCWNGSKPFDNCSFIWKNFSSDEYITAYGEDSAWMGAFRYEKKGFMNKPTDYYWNTFEYYAEKKLGNAHRGNVDLCIGSREVYKIFLNYVEKFVNRMDVDSLRYFSFFWSSTLSHDVLNLPKIGDGTYAEFFKKLKSDGRLDDTVLVWMSDHGMRWGGIRETHIGRMEESLPFLFFVLPERFKKTYPQAHVNLIKNTRRLTTPFDLHETLKDLLDPSGLLNEKDGSGRGLSLFQEISKERTCELAGIASHWCTCLNSLQLNVTDEIVFEASTYAVKTMNKYLEGHSDCMKLQLKTIKNAHMLSLQNDMNMNKNYNDYLLTIQTTPGDGVFEVTVRATKNKNNINFVVVGTISRLNLYGRQSLCISDFHLKLYCYCKNYVP